MNWKLLFRGLGTVWLLTLVVIGIVGYYNLGTTDNGQFALAFVGIGVVGLLVALVIAAACPEMKK